MEEVLSTQKFSKARGYIRYTEMEVMVLDLLDILFSLIEKVIYWQNLTKYQWLNDIY